MGAFVENALIGGCRRAGTACGRRVPLGAAGAEEYSKKLSKQEVKRNVVKVRRNLLEDNYEISVGIETGSCDENKDETPACGKLPRAGI